MEEYSEGNRYKKYWQSSVIGSMWQGGGLFCGTCLLQTLVLRLGRPFWCRQSNRYIWKYKKKKSLWGRRRGNNWASILYLRHSYAASRSLLYWSFYQHVSIEHFLWWWSLCWVLIVNTTVLTPAPMHPIVYCGRQMDNLNRQFQTLVLQSH